MERATLKRLQASKQKTLHSKKRKRKSAAAVAKKRDAKEVLRSETNFSWEKHERVSSPGSLEIFESEPREINAIMNKATNVSERCYYSVG